MKLALAYTVALLLLLFYLIFGHNGVLKSREMGRTLEIYEEKIRSMREENLALSREIDKLKNDPAYMEYVIKRELGLQKADEDQYIITDNGTTKGK